MIHPRNTELRIALRQPTRRTQQPLLLFALVVALLAVACGISLGSTAPADDSTAAVAPSSSYTEIVTPPPGTPLPDTRVAEILALLLQVRPDEAELGRSLEDIEANRDNRFIAPLIEIMRAGPARTAIWNAGYGDVLREISGVTFATDWVNWGSETIPIAAMAPRLA